MKKKVLFVSSLLLVAGMGTSQIAEKRGRAQINQTAARGTFENVAVVNPNNTTVVESGFSDWLGGIIHARNNFGATVVAIEADSFGDGIVTVQDGRQNPRATMWVNNDGVGEVTVWDRGTNPRYSMAGDKGFVAWGGDISENFTSLEQVDEGSLMVLDPAHPEQLKLSNRPYDRLVAGVVAGANDYEPGMTLGVVAGRENQIPVTLTGTTYCWASNVNGAIRIGDLLTTSSIPGHAMKVMDYAAAQGAIIGKAMEAMEGDRGLVKIIVSLQ